MDIGGTPLLLLDTDIADNTKPTARSRIASTAAIGAIGWSKSCCSAWAECGASERSAGRSASIT